MKHFSRSHTSGPSPAAWIHGSGTAVFVPEGYERGYRYPLVCWLEDSRSPVPAACRWFPGASRRNCVAISLRAPVTVSHRGAGAVWRVADEGDRWTALDYVGSSIAEVAAQLSIHPDRIYLAGAGDGAETAVHLAALDTDRFAGAIAIDPRRPATAWSRGDFAHAAPRRLLLIQSRLRSSFDGERSDEFHSCREVISGTDLDAAAKKLMDWLLSPISTVCREKAPPPLAEISED